MQIKIWTGAIQGSESRTAPVRICSSGTDRNAHKECLDHSVDKFIAEFGEWYVLDMRSSLSGDDPKCNGFWFFSNDFPIISSRQYPIPSY